MLTAPAGSNGLLVIPHFSGSAAPYWNPIAKGLVFNMGLGTTRGEMCRAILEGIAGEITENISIMQENTQKAETVYASGGLTNFEEYCSILADNLQLKVNRRKNTEATLLGCLLSACVTMGIYPDYRTAFTRVVSGECREYQPRTENKEAYEKARALRKDIYNALSAADIYTKAQQL